MLPDLLSYSTLYVLFVILIDDWFVKVNTNLGFPKPLEICFLNHYFNLQYGLIKVQVRAVVFFD